MAQPVLDCPGFVSRIGQREAASVPQHVSMYREIEAGALRNPFDVPVNRVWCEWSTPLSGEYKGRFRKLATKPSQVRRAPP
jgi:hypothetical protein